MGDRGEILSLADTGENEGDRYWVGTVVHYNNGDKHNVLNRYLVGTETMDNSQKVLLRYRKF